MDRIALIDTRPEVPGETLGSLISIHRKVLHAFKANDAFQARMRASGIKSYVRTKIVTLKAAPRPGEQVKLTDLADNAAGE